MAETSIEWTDRVWNPVRGCSRVSPGCENCYAEVMAARFSDPGQWGHGFAERTEHGGRWTRKVAPVPEKLAEPLSWRKARRVFVNSTSDLFHEDVPDEFIAAVFGVMAACPQHTFQCLTKRPERMRRWFEEQGDTADGLADEARYHGIDLPFTTTLQGWPLPNVWLGVSVEDQRRADERIPHLLRVPAAVRFLSVEPLLGPVDLTALRGETCDVCGGTVTYDAFDATATCDCCIEGGEPVAWESLDWLIVGGESGPGARPFDISWARSLVVQCREGGVPVFVKQMGARPVTSTPEHPSDAPRVIDHDGTVGLFDLVSRKGGDLDEFPEDLRIREFPDGR